MISFNSDNNTALLNREHIQNLVNSLREVGIDAVSYMDKEASNPSKFVVNSEGIQTPFLSPKDALKATVLIEDIVCKRKDMHLSGHANLLSNNSILYTTEKRIRNWNNRGLDIVAGNPHAEKMMKYYKNMEKV